MELVPDFGASLPLLPEDDIVLSSGPGRGTTTEMLQGRMNKLIANAPSKRLKDMRMLLKGM